MGGERLCYPWCANVVAVTRMLLPGYKGRGQLVVVPGPSASTSGCCREGAECGSPAPHPQSPGAPGVLRASRRPRESRWGHGQVLREAAGALMLAQRGAGVPGGAVIG